MKVGCGGMYSGAMNIFLAKVLKCLFREVGLCTKYHRIITPLICRERVAKASADYHAPQSIIDNPI
jgi:hypothetical protein